ncbi:MAG: pyridoxal 5'-phosphate synthase glutaminase subunit PdxT [Candidatus Humimicrobiaceae bacterium]
MAIKVGVLALQGAFREHIKSINSCGALGLEVKFPGQLEEAGGLIIPGGESTTINKLIVKYGFRKPLDEFYNKGKPIFGTCAGMIMVGRKVIGEDFGLGYINVIVNRNAYGRQIDSFEEYIDLKLGASTGKKFKAIFIRAPKILEIGDNVKVLGKTENEIVLAREGNVMVSAFHPELGDDLRIHKYFLGMVNKFKEKRVKENVRAF